MRKISIISTLYVVIILAIRTGGEIAASPSQPVASPKSLVPLVFNVRELGAKGDGRAFDTGAIQKALDLCGQAGGGTVRLPAGTYLSRPLFLRSEVALQLDAGAVLLASDDPADFADAGAPRSVWAFVNGRNLTNVSILGRGVIDGAGTRWWEPVREGKRLAKAAGKTFKETVNRPRMIILSHCINVNVRGVTLQNAPTFHLVPVDCENVDIDGVTIRSPADAPNTDAIDPSSSRYVRIANCVLDTGDDNIAIKSGRVNPAHPGAAVEHVVITNCTFLNGHGMSIGSETVGGVRDLRVENCVFNGTTSGIRIKSARDRGGIVENLVYSNIIMTNVNFPIHLTSYYPKVPKGDAVQPMSAKTPVYRNIQIHNVRASGARSAGAIIGVPECAISNVVLDNVHITAPEGMTVRNAHDIEFKNSTIAVDGGKSLILETNASVIGFPGSTRTTTIVLVGDSTVTDSAGWGLGFKQFLAEGVECVNTAQGGRSSMSFMKEGRWTNALALKGDYYLIQFGHNNEPGKPGRSTDMATFVTNMEQYVEDVRAIGATPILVTPLTRRQWDKEHSGKIRSSLSPYAEEVRKIAAAKHVPLVDLHARSIELCESLGPEKCLEFSPTKTNDAGKVGYDGTHLKGNGWVMFARLVVNELRTAVPALTPALRAEPVTSQPESRESRYDAVVSADGSGTHTTVQAAVAAAPANRTRPFMILIKPGRYDGQIIVPKDKRHIHFVGEELANTVLSYPFNVFETNNINDSHYNGTGVIVLGDDYAAENITFENSSGDHGQALALRVDGDRAVFTNCRMLGWQDTLMVNNARQYFTNCTIEGRVDFIYGSATAVFDHCEIHSKNGGHITAANTPEAQSFGFVFLDCRLTGDPTPWVDPTKALVTPSKKKPMADLGRPWRAFACVAYLRCEMGGHIKASGWDNWGKPENEKTARYSEYRSTGPGGDPAGRVRWARQLTDDEAARYTISNILKGTDGWNPTVAP